MDSHEDHFRRNVGEVSPGYRTCVRVLRVFHSAAVSAWRGRESELRALGHDVRVIGAARWNEGGSLVDFEARPGEPAEGVRTWGTHPALFLYDPRPLWRALGERWDVIDIHEEPFALATAEVLAIRALRRCRAPYLLYTAQNLEKRYPLPFRWLERRALRHASAVVACNSEAARIAQRKGFPGVADVVPLGVDLKLFHPVEKPRGTSAAVEVGYVGRWATHKGVDVLLDAVAQEPDLRLTMIGAGPQEERYRARAAQTDLTGRVQFTGPRTPEELPAALTALDVLAVPSLTTPGWVEQFGRVVVEAMACGVPVVASDSGALPDLVQGAGLLVPEGDASALGEGLVRVGRDPQLARRLREAGLARAAECSWPALATRYEHVYRRITRTLPVSPRSGADPEVIVVAYGSPTKLRVTLLPVRDLQVTVVDNSSLPEIRDLCAELAVHYLDPGQNAGFGAGVNHGLRHRQHPERDVLLLNPDAVVTADDVRALHEALRAEADLASVGPAQVDAAGQTARVVWPFPSPLRSWVEAVGLGRLTNAPDYVIGSVLLLRAEAIAQVGGFDEDFFLYAEETDWARRASRLGWRHAMVPTITVLHEGAGTSTDSGRRETYFAAGIERYLRKHHGSVGWQLSRAAQVCGAVLRSQVLTGEKRQAAVRRASLLRRGPLRLERALRSGTMAA
jgi:glycosyltransferase involved in cell wall biosynthesis/GT2 family glycosyltransferase